MKQADKLAEESGISSMDLMERAGLGVVSYILSSYSHFNKVLVMCGPGNNGGDGFVIARQLIDVGRDVEIFLYGEIDDLSGDALAMALRWEGATHSLTSKNLKASLDKTSGDLLVVDALFGAGLNKKIEGDLPQCIEMLNLHDNQIISVDIPSGIDGNSGAILGPAIQADMTVTFFRYKPGHLLYPGRGLCGDIRLVDIGIPEDVLEKISSDYAINDLPFWIDHFPVPDERTHKYKRGHGVVISGPQSQTGASRLGARGALRVGAGLVTVFCPEDALLVHACHLTSIMVQSFKTSDDLETLLKDKRKNVVLIGPNSGVGKYTKDNVVKCLDSGADVVLDADALTSYADEPNRLVELVHKRKDRFVVMTPHEGEFSRLFGVLFDDEQKTASKLDKAKRAAQLMGAIVIYKGADTVIACPDGRVAINHNAPAYLATAGSGDVLAGIITGLIAQEVPAYEACCIAVWMHGDAANMFGPGLIAEDLPEILPDVISRIVEHNQ